MVPLRAKYQNLRDPHYLREPSMEKQGLWDIFVDIVTIAWLILFVISFIELNPVLNERIDQILFWILPIFVMDLVVKYLRIKKPKEFLRKHWLDILTTIPYFRFLRIARISRALRLVKVAKSVKATKAIKSSKTIKWAKKGYNTIKAIKKAMKGVKKKKRSSERD